MKKNKMKYGVIVLLVALLTTGCGNKIPELSEQEQELVVEYAREVVLKHDRNYQSRLVDLSLEQENVNEEEPETPSEEEDEASSDAKETDGQEVSVTDNTQTEVQNVTLEEFLKLDDVKFTYNGYELDNFYPQQGEELYFIMEATQGSKLLVLKFLAENTSGTEINLDIAKTETRFKIIADGVGKNALTTMLLNDLTYYQGTIAPEIGRASCRERVLAGV